MVKFDSMTNEDVRGALCTRSSPRSGLLKVTRPINLGYEFDKNGLRGVEVGNEEEVDGSGCKAEVRYVRRGGLSVESRWVSSARSANPFRGIY